LKKDIPAVLARVKQLDQIGKLKKGSPWRTNWLGRGNGMRFPSIIFEDNTPG
jgi:hypothetical protein